MLDRVRARLHGLAWLPLTLIVLVGGMLRFWGILHGLRDGLIYHPDANWAVHDVWHRYLGAPWAGAHFGMAYDFLVALAMWAADAATRYLGYPVSWSFELIASTSSLLTATLGTATIAVAYLLGRRAGGRATGLLAAALLAVCPLHSFQSHYPYRDVPMVLFLSLTLAACVAVAERPTVAGFVLAGLGAAVTMALKPAGLAVVAPLAAASVLAWLRLRRLRVLVAIGGLVGVGVVALAALKGGSPGEVLQSQGRFVTDFFSAYGPRLIPGVAIAAWILRTWLGLPYLMALAVGVGYAAWRRRASDLVLLAFVVPAYLAAATYPWLDERFLVFLLPPGAVLLGRAVADAWSASARLRPARVVLGLGIAGLLLTGLVRSGWQGVLLSLPDTRALAGQWLDAHLPRATRVAVEGYYPLGVDQWPNVSFFDPRAPFAREAAKAEILITSSTEHQRYLDEPGRYPREIASFFEALPREAERIKSFALESLGFVDPRIDVYTTTPPPASPAPRLMLPRPYDTRWNGGVSFADAGPYDRDDRTVWLSGAQGYTATLVSRVPVDEVVVFVLNGPEPSRVRVRVGWRSRTRALGPGEWRVLRFRPRWPLPLRPALYRFDVGLVPEGTGALIQLRSGDREIGEAYARWQQWERASPYLERAVARSGADPGTWLLLATTYQRSGRPAEARRTWARAVAADPSGVDRYLRLARSEASPDEWAREFREVTGLEPALLAAALARELEAEALIVRQARVVPDAAASGGLSVAFDRTRDAPGLVVNGPTMGYLASGAYRARFFLRAWDATGGGPVAVLKVAGEPPLRVSRPASANELGDGRRFVEVSVPFVHTDQEAEVDFQVEATGLANLAVDRIRLEPDLRASVRLLAREAAPLLPSTAAAGTR